MQRSGVRFERRDCSPHPRGRESSMQRSKDGCVASVTTAEHGGENGGGRRMKAWVYLRTRRRRGTGRRFLERERSATATTRTATTSRPSHLRSKDLRTTRRAPRLLHLVNNHHIVTSQVPPILLRDGCTATGPLSSHSFSSRSCDITLRQSPLFA